MCGAWFARWLRTGSLIATCCQAYSCLQTSDNRTLLAGGHNWASVNVWNLSVPSLYMKEAAL
jgi:hypothetical protein